MWTQEIFVLVKYRRTPKDPRINLPPSTWVTDHKQWEGVKNNPERREKKNPLPHCYFQSAKAKWARMWKRNAHMSIWKCTSSAHAPPAAPPSHLPPLKQLCCFGPALKAVLITGTERRSEWQVGSILLKPNERKLCRVWGLRRLVEAMSLPIVPLFLSVLEMIFFYFQSISESYIFGISLVSITDFGHWHSFSFVFSSCFYSKSLSFSILASDKINHLTCLCLLLVSQIFTFL